jgi:GMP synthase (glutamine-hydrolysing)
VTSAPRLLVVQHEDPCPPAWFGGWLRAEGVELDVVRAHLGEPLPQLLDGYDGLLVLGGEMGAGDDARCAWLPPVKGLIAAATEQDVPLLGICLGHQLATVALGGTVERSPRGRTRGVVPIGLTAAGEADPLLGGCDGLPSVHWNGDIAVCLPAGTTLLATTPDGAPQAVRFGRCAWGVQFHPEASAAVVAGWAVPRGPQSPVPAHVQAAVDAVTAAEDQLRSAWRPLATRFADVLKDPPA